MQEVEIKTQNLEDPTIEQPVVDSNNEGQKKQSKLSAILKNKYFLMILVMSAIAVLALGGAYTYIIVSGKPDNVDIGYELVGADRGNMMEGATRLPEPPEVKEIENPLNGQLLSQDEWEEMQDKPVVVVMINNHVAARPQSGLSKADIVYEALAESGITRYMAVYWGPNSKDVDEVGPIRSIRQYYVDWAIEYEVPVVMHIGWAGYDPPIDTVVVPEADSRTYILSHPEQLSSLQSSFWRDPNRVSPHNAYNSIENILKVAGDRSWGNEGIRDPYKFKGDAKLDDRPLTSTMEITFLQSSSNNYTSRWEYNRDSNVYLRSIAGVEDIDKITGKQIEVKNVVLQHTEYRLALDEHARILLTTVGSGKAQFMIDGSVVEGTWSKDSKTGMTKYYGEDEKEMEFNRGQIWIVVVPNTNGEVEGSLEIT